MELKTINELNEGACTVVAKYGDKVRNFEGTYAANLGIVFMAVPDRFEIIGYIQ